MLLAKPHVRGPKCAAPCNEMMPVQCLRKVPYTTFREEPAEKVEKCRAWSRNRFPTQ